MRYRLRTLLIVLALAHAFLASAGCIRGPNDRPAELTRDINQADSIVLYEGLPHPFYEEDSFQKERTTKPVKQIDEYFFYQEPLTFNAGDEKGLKALLGDTSMFRPFEGEKKCGGFHPDYAVEVRHGSSVYYFLLCFGCHEIKAVGTQTASRYDMSDKGGQQLAALLQPYHKNRPEREAGRFN